jgi:hypothetical protein
MSEKDRRRASWALAFGVLAYWTVRILRRDRPLQVERERSRPAARRPPDL